MCDASNPNINVHEKKPARGRARDSLSRAEKRSESAKPYNRQSSKSRECFQNRSSQSVSKKNKWDPIVVLSTDLDLISVLKIHMFS
ncbi:hypothetical protein DPMN_075410 [Dreissena polymorpha]|uniref:Uncharacterized protein n=1 Tax=Dreissena polymorpha TaxID=45954 RepID=A0A9D3YKF3_DREPO|nr:hypothetical protein DPMN_075410 [Dreissena polymorpha]